MTTLYVTEFADRLRDNTVCGREFADRLRGNIFRVSILAGRLEDKGRVHVSEASPIVPVSVSCPRVCGLVDGPDDNE